MIKYKYGILENEGVVKFADGTSAKCSYADGCERLYRLNHAGEIMGVANTTKEIFVCDTVRTVSGVVDSVIQKILVDVPDGSSVEMLAGLIRLVNLTETDIVEFLPYHVDGTPCYFPKGSTVYRYGEFLRDKMCVRFYGYELEVDRAFQCGESLYRIVGDTVVNCVGVVPIRVDEKVSGDKLPMVSFSGHKVFVLAPPNSTVMLPTEVLGSCGNAVSVFVPTHLDGAVDQPAKRDKISDSDTVMCIYDIGSELQRLQSDKEYRMKVSKAIDSVMLAMPPSQRDKDNILLQVCELASVLARGGEMEW